VTETGFLRLPKSFYLTALSEASDRLPKLPSLAVTAFREAWNSFPATKSLYFTICSGLPEAEYSTRRSGFQRLAHRAASAAPVQLKLGGFFIGGFMTIASKSNIQNGFSLFRSLRFDLLKHREVRDLLLCILHLKTCYFFSKFR